MRTTVVYKDAKILIVDDQPMNIQLLERVLRRAGYSNIRTTTYPKGVIPIFREFDPDIILLDLHMPEMDGRELIQLILPLVPKPIFLPIIVITADNSTKAKQEALLVGAHDFLTKPLDSVEVLLRIRILLQSRFLSLEVQQSNQILEEKVTQRTHEMQLAQIALVESLAKASEYRDDDTGEHANRIEVMSRKMALILGYSHEDAESIGLAASLHDIGKIGIPDEILSKPTTLTDEEFDIIKTHTTIGKNIISKINFPLLNFARNIIHTHHERWDGTGYPRGLKGDEIPLEGQIVSIVDVYDNMTHLRPYKTAWSTERAVKEIMIQRDKQFGSKIVDAFLEIVSGNSLTSGGN